MFWGVFEKNLGSKHIGPIHVNWYNYWDAILSTRPSSVHVCLLVIIIKYDVSSFTM